MLYLTLLILRLPPPAACCIDMVRAQETKNNTMAASVTIFFITGILEDY
jgi:hypothetical protein